MGTSYSKANDAENAEYLHRNDLHYNLRVTVDDGNGNYSV